VAKDINEMMRKWKEAVKPFREIVRDKVFAVVVGEVDLKIEEEKS